MAYELFLLPVPAGADVEETAEALLALISLGHDRGRGTQAARERVDALVGRLVAAEPALVRDPPRDASPGAVELRAASGLVVTVTDRYVRLLVPFVLRGDAATEELQRLFRVASQTADATGWRPYDPQEAEGIALDEASCDAALEVYLTVMDQLLPAGGPRSGEVR